MGLRSLPMTSASGFCKACMQSAGGCKDLSHSSCLTKLYRPNTGACTQVKDMMKVIPCGRKVKPAVHAQEAKVMLKIFAHVSKHPLTTTSMTLSTPNLSCSSYRTETMLAVMV